MVQGSQEEAAAAVVRVQGSVYFTGITPAELKPNQAWLLVTIQCVNPPGSHVWCCCCCWLGKWSDLVLVLVLLLACFCQ